LPKREVSHGGSSLSKREGKRGQIAGSYCRGRGRWQSAARALIVAGESPKSIRSER
jgi:hypothetical protein